jgi:hypothetical protein
MKCCRCWLVLPNPTVDQAGHHGAGRRSVLASRPGCPDIGPLARHVLDQSCMHPAMSMDAACCFTPPCVTRRRDREPHLASVDWTLRTLWTVFCAAVLKGPGKCPARRKKEEPGRWSQQCYQNCYQLPAFAAVSAVSFALRHAVFYETQGSINSCSRVPSRLVVKRSQVQILSPRHQ